MSDYANYTTYQEIYGQLSRRAPETRAFRQYPYWPQQVKANIALIATSETLWADMYNQLANAKTSSAFYSISSPDLPKGADNAPALARAALGTQAGVAGGIAGRSLALAPPQKTTRRSERPASTGLRRPHPIVTRGALAPVAGRVARTGHHRARLVVAQVPARAWRDPPARQNADRFHAVRLACFDERLDALALLLVRVAVARLGHQASAAS